MHCLGIETLVIGSGVTTIPEHLLYNCNELKSVTFTNSVKTVCYGAISHCDAFTDIYFIGSKQDKESIEIDPLWNDIIKNAKDIKGLHVATAKMDCCDANALRQLGDLIRDKDSSCVAVISTVNNGKISFQCVCSKAAIEKGVKAGDVIKNITAIVGGKGGGKPDSAMGGGSDVSKLDEALKAVETYVNEKVKE